MEANTKFKAVVKRGLYPATEYWFDALWGNFKHGDGWIGMLEIGETDKSKRYMVDPDDCEIAPLEAPDLLLNDSHLVEHEKQGG